MTKVKRLANQLRALIDFFCMCSSSLDTYKKVNRQRYRSSDMILLLII